MPQKRSTSRRKGPENRVSTGGKPAGVQDENLAISGQPRFRQKIYRRDSPRGFVVNPVNLWFVQTRRAGLANREEIG